MQDLIEGIINWDKFEASSTMSTRLGGITKELLEVEVELWEKQLQMLEPLDSVAIKKEIAAWDFSIPKKGLNFDLVAATYARVVGYKTRVGFLLSDAMDWNETCDSAIDYIKDIAQGAFPGTAVDKKANAMHVCQPFIHLRNQTKSLVNYLEKVNGSVNFTATHLDLLLKERQSQNKLNFRLGHEGETALAELNSNQPEIIIDGDDIFERIKKN